MLIFESALCVWLRHSKMTFFENKSMEVALLNSKWGSLSSDVLKNIDDFRVVRPIHPCAHLMKGIEIRYIADVEPYAQTQMRRIVISEDTPFNLRIPGCNTGLEVEARQYPLRKFGNHVFDPLEFRSKLRSRFKLGSVTDEALHELYAERTTRHCYPRV